MIVSRAPVRFSLGGGGTDLPSYSREHGGFLVAAAVDKFVNVCVARRFQNNIRLAYSESEIVDSTQHVKHRIFKAALEMTGFERGLELHSLADVPANTGLGSSSSFTVALLNGLHAFKREFVPAEQLAREACQLEIDILKEPIGKQDQYIAAYGGITALTFNKDGSVDVERLPLREEIIDELESNLIIYYSGVERSASEHFFSESAVLQQTILLKPHPTEPKSNRVSIGNGILRRYTLHVDFLHRSMLIEERVIVEHLTWIEQLVATILFTYFLGLVTFSLELLTPLTLGIGHRKPGTDEIENSDSQHTRISSHSLREAIFFVIILVVPPVVLARLPVFVPHCTRYAFFYVWAWTTLGVNAICLLINLYYSLTVARGNRPAAGTFLWRSFRIGLSRVASAEHLALLGIFCISLILRREGLGTPIGAAVGAITIANGVSQLYLDVRFKLSLHAIIEAHRQSPVPVRKVDFPRRSDNKLWAAYVLLVLFLVNTVAPTILFITEVFYVVTKFSVASSILIAALSICAGLWVVNQYGAAEMRREK